MRGEKFEFRYPQGGQPAIIAAAAHELKTPLTVISYLADILTDETLELTDSDRMLYTHRLKSVSSRMLKLVQDLTLCYRLQDEAQLGFKFALEPVNMQELCESALQELWPLAKENNQTLQLNNCRSPIALVNRGIAYDMIVNLVENSIKHNPKSSSVIVQIGSKNSAVRLAVKDFGPQITKKDFNNLSQNLGAMPQPFAGHSDSSGLGIYIVNQLARAMGGKLGLSRNGAGAAFFVDFIRSKQLSLL